MTVDLLPATFVCAPLGKHCGTRLGPFLGYVQVDAPHRPLFSFEEAQRLAGEWDALPPSEGGACYGAHYNTAKESFCFYDAAAEAWHAWEGEDVGIAVLYPVGEGAWRWYRGS